MTIQELKVKNIASGGKFFSRDTMKYFGDTMKNFGIETLPSGIVRVYRKRPTLQNGGKVGWYFDANTGRMIP